MTRLGVYTGTFDPITLGHLNIIERSRSIVDELVVGIGMNFTKSPMFSLEERISLVEQSVQDFGFVQVRQYDGLTVDFVRSINARIMVRGIRPWSAEFEGEMKMATANRQLAEDVETVFLISEQHLWHVSSSLVREVALHSDEATLCQFVPPSVAQAVMAKVQS